MSRSIPVYRLQLQRSGGVAGLPSRCESARDAYELFRSHLGDPDREHLLAIFLNWHRRVLGVHVVAVGSRNLLHSEAREIFATGLLLHASDVVLVHNHPSGDATPSEEDEFRTRELEIAGLLLGVTVLDHIVVGENDYQSIRATNRMVLPLDSADELSEEQIEERVQEVLGLHLRQAKAQSRKAKRQKRTNNSGAAK
jgi:DNA repair protein RadC